MKISISILFLVVLALPSLLKFSIYIDFKINQQLIAQELCIMKEVPNNCCQGKCQLDKELKKVDTQQNENFPKAVLFQLRIEAFINEEEINFIPENDTLKYLVSQTHNYSAPYLLGIDEPPKFIL